jgi:anti-sigma B factor antagonist
MNQHADTRPMQVSTWLDAGRGVVEVIGDVDVYTAAELRAAITRAQAKARASSLAIVLAELTFMDSSGLGVLVGAHKRAAMAGGRIALVGTPEPFLRVLRVTGLSGLMPSFGDTAAAFAWLSSQRPKR